MRALVAFLFFVSCSVQAASNWWLVVPATSWHKEDKPYNEDNWGCGFQYDFTNTFSVVSVRYPNSFDVWTTGIGLSWSPEIIQINMGPLLVKPAIAPTYLRGYNGKKWELLPIPSIDFIWNRKFGVNVISDFDTFVGFSFKWRF